MAAAIGAAAPFLGQLERRTGHWLAFAVLAGAASAAQLFPVRTPRDYSFQMTGVFLIPAALLLPPPLVALIAIVQHVPEWLKARHPWYMQSFNIANYTIATLAAAGCARLALRLDPVTNDSLRFALAGVAAALVFVIVNHGVLATMLRLARGHSLRESGLFSFEGLSTDLTLAALGVGVAALWAANPWLIPFALAPLALIHRALSVPQLQAEARVDPKTGLFNARHFSIALAEELARAERFQRPLSLIMADLDLLRDVNNTHGHLAGDAVLKGVADVFRLELRHYDVPARFGGEEFSILLPETTPERAVEIAERIRKAVARSTFGAEVSSTPIKVTISLGVAAYPRHATDAQRLIHEADLAVYRAKLQGRNRVLLASSEPLLVPAVRNTRLAAVPEEPPPVVHAERPRKPPEHDRRRPSVADQPARSLSGRLRMLVTLVSVLGIGAGIAGLLAGGRIDLIGFLAVLAFVGIGQALALEVIDQGSLSVSAVGALAGAALFGPKAALLLAVATCAVDWSARRTAFHHTVFNIGVLTLASLAAAGVFAGSASLADAGFVPNAGGGEEVAWIVGGLVAGAVYFTVNMGLLSIVLALDGGGGWADVFRTRFAWLLPHYVFYGFVAVVIAIAYETAGLYALAVFALPLLLMRKTQDAYIAETRRSAEKLRGAAETIQRQNVSLERANALLKERSTAAMASLSATVDIRDAYTAGHARRVQELSLAIGRELGLSLPELDLLGHAALFHDIGKLSVPDAILLKPSTLTTEEWLLMERHSDEGARIIDRLGFLNDAVPAIRHHHERWDGSGYPDGLKGEDIPLGARIIHVADALDSMLTTRSYRRARPADEALAELLRASGTQFCPRCVAAAERIFPELESRSTGEESLAAAS
jgi:diguanylate cyclase (GGDEF)-like protein/putative nucleotidyltransferase with HDIG domain